MCGLSWALTYRSLLVLNQRMAGVKTNPRSEQPVLDLAGSQMYILKLYH